MKGMRLVWKFSTVFGTVLQDKEKFMTFMIPEKPIGWCFLFIGIVGAVLTFFGGGYIMGMVSGFLISAGITAIRLS